MSSDITTFDGADWQTDRRALAQLLSAIDEMQAFTYGLTAGEAMGAGTIIGFDLDKGALDESAQLAMMADMAQEALISIDGLAADLAAGDVPARTRWNLVEARQLMFCVRSLAAEAREAIMFNHLREIPAGVLMEFDNSFRRIKLLLTNIDDVSHTKVA
ncbi:MAG: hypothetical protein AB7G06_00245 [Bdellovibrionales bacterium]